MLTRQPAYNAVYEVIRHHPCTAEQNGVIWRAVEAALDAMGVPPNKSALCSSSTAPRQVG